VENKPTSSIVVSLSIEQGTKRDASTFMRIVGWKANRNRGNIAKIRQNRF